MTNADNDAAADEPNSKPAGGTWWSASADPAGTQGSAGTPADGASSSAVQGAAADAAGADTSTSGVSWYNVGVPIDKAPDSSTWAQSTSFTAASPPGAPPGAPPTFGTAPPLLPPVAAPAPAAPRAKRKLKGPLIGAALLAGLGYGGYVGYGLLFGATGGSGSPEAAVQRAVDAVDKADIPGVLASMSPRELNGIDAVGRKALKIADDALGTKGSKERAGIDPEISDVELEAEELAPGVSKVTVKSLRASVTANKAAVAVAEGAVAPVIGEDRAQEGQANAKLRIRNGHRVTGDSSQGSAEGDFDADLSHSLGRDGDVFAIAVEEEGGWYISPMLTAAEYTRLYFDNDRFSEYYNELPDPDWELLSKPDDLKKEFDPGEEKPEDAVDAAIDMLSDGDIEALTKAVPSDSGAAIAVFGDSIRKIGNHEDLSANPGLRDDMKGLSIDGEIISNENGIALYRVNEFSNDRNSFMIDGTQECGKEDRIPARRNFLSNAIGCSHNQRSPLLALKGIVALREVDDGDRTGWKVDPALSLIESAKATLDGFTGTELAASLGSLSVDRDPAHVVAVNAEKGKIVTAAPKPDSAGYTVFDVTAPPKAIVQFWPVNKAGTRTAFTGRSEIPNWGTFSVGAVSKNKQVTGAFQMLPTEMLVASETGKIRIGVLAFGADFAKMNFAITEVTNIDVPESGVKTSLSDVPISLLQIKSAGQDIDVESAGITDMSERYGGQLSDDLGPATLVADAAYGGDMPSLLTICTTCEDGTIYMVLREPGAKEASLTLTPRRGGFSQGDSFSATIPFSETFRVLPGKSYEIMVSAPSYVDPEIFVYGSNGNVISSATSSGSTDSVGFHLTAGSSPEELRVEIRPYGSGDGATVNVSVQTSDY